MPQACSICHHPQRLDIERAIVAGASMRDVAGQFGTSKSAVDRHKPHVMAAVTTAAAVIEQKRARSLLQDIRDGEDRAHRLLEQAEEILASARRDEDPKTALQAIRTGIAALGEARAYAEVRGELTNELGRDRPQAEVAIQIVIPGHCDEPRVRLIEATEFEAVPEDGLDEIGFRSAS